MNKANLEKLLKIFLGALLVFAGPISMAQQSGRAAVYVQSTSEDSVGRTLVYEIREAVRRSSGFTLVASSADARFVLRIVTLNPDNDSTRSVSTVYSAVYTLNTLHETPVEMYLTSVVGTCGTSRVANCARSLTATLDEQATLFQRILRNAFDPNERR